MKAEQNRRGEPAGRVEQKLSNHRYGGKPVDSARLNVQPILHGGVLYGYDDSGLVAVELPSGKRLWDTNGPLPGDPKGPDTAFIVRNGDRFFLLAETGELVIGKMTPKGDEEVSRAKLLDQTGAAFGRKVVWCAPADKKAYIRNDKEIVCIDLAK